MLKTHGRYSYSAIHNRPDFSWSNGNRLAVFFALNLEHYPFGSPLAEQLVPSMNEPDVMNYAWCDYGSRVGIWRLKSLFEEFKLPVTLLVNSEIYSYCPEVMDAFRAGGHEIVCHGRTNAEQQGSLDEASERSLILEATQAVTQHEGKQPKGWLGPWISESYVTPDLLKEIGYDYVLDWCCDDQPIWLQTRSGPLLSLPYPQEINDSNVIIGRLGNAREFADMMIDQFDEMLLQSDEQPLVYSVALHANIAGQPFRIRQLRRALTHIASCDASIWVACAGDIAQHFVSNTQSVQAGLLDV